MSMYQSLMVYGPVPYGITDVDLCSLLHCNYLVEAEKNNGFYYHMLSVTMMYWENFKVTGYCAAVIRMKN